MSGSTFKVHGSRLKTPKQRQPKVSAIRSAGPPTLRRPWIMTTIRRAAPELGTRKGFLTPGAELRIPRSESCDFRGSRLRGSFGFIFFHVFSSEFRVRFSCRAAHRGCRALVARVADPTYLCSFSQLIPFHAFSSALRTPRSALRRFRAPRSTCPPLRCWTKDFQYDRRGGAGSFLALNDYISSTVLCGLKGDIGPETEPFRTLHPQDLEKGQL